MSTTTTSTRDFSWSESDEPHATRRKLILAKHPQMKNLFGPEILTFPIVIAIVSFQICMAYWIRDQPWYIFWACAYAIGGTLNHTLQLAVHELSHNLCFHWGTGNRLLGIFANTVTCVPSAVTFQRYHMEHHQFQGVDGIDADIPTTTEVQIFVNAIHKTIWLLLQPGFYALRPLAIKPKNPGMWEIINWIVAITFDVSVYYFWGGRALLYLIAGTILGLGLHPAAGHFIAEHYELVRGSETYSYYGILNWVNFNVGYHNEHHDFPKIPWSRLPAVRRVAPEFYDHLPHYTSYIAVMWRYITDPEVGPHSRIKRVNKQAKSE
jgi:sphingolipid delta-4 desaturase